MSMKSLIVAGAALFFGALSLGPLAAVLPLWVALLGAGLVVLVVAVGGSALIVASEDEPDLWHRDPPGAGSEPEVEAARRTRV